MGRRIARVALEDEGDGTGRALRKRQVDLVAIGERALKGPVGADPCTERRPTQTKLLNAVPRTARIPRPALETRRKENIYTSINNR